MHLRKSANSIINAEAKIRLMAGLKRFRLCQGGVCLTSTHTHTPVSHLDDQNCIILDECVCVYMYACVRTVVTCLLHTQTHRIDSGLTIIEANVDCACWWLCGSMRTHIEANILSDGKEGKGPS